MIVDEPLVPRLTINVPVLITLPAPVMVLLPATPKVTPPFAVTVPVTVMLDPELTPTFKEPEPSLFEFNWMEPV